MAPVEHGRKTVRKGIVRAVVTTAAYSLGPLAVIAPVFGDFMTECLQHQGVSDGIKIGAAKGFLVAEQLLGSYAEDARECSRSTRAQCAGVAHCAADNLNQSIAIVQIDVYGE